ncbi:NADPH-dependent FMN reductase [Actinokineospora auranticolor]|uniref:FMN reductase n=1 Tax=Actinokineospora auranticolor TaxID=155976 RepID=A0A2S6GPD3_9PSEU|nr:NADPH-dependent FMN reductase [Actinokineospora auranticolor]PPK67088.1 FMN reductase [Actinokineospora auranticolor]
MSRIIVLSGSPSPVSRTASLADLVADTLPDAVHLRLRELPAAPLLSADRGDQAITRATEKVAAADGVVLVTPIYKASFSGLLKIFLDLLPQDGFAGKTVAPLAVGRSIAHLLAIDYGLRPVVQSMSPKQVLRGHFLLEQHLSFDSTGRLRIEEEGQTRVTESLTELLDSLALHATRPRALTDLPG